ncbi:MAG: 16S rRNA (guanine(527)-N(7))-methyltransferase RsmG [Bacteroidota bacterium]
MQILEEYFPELTQEQKDRFFYLGELYPFWNNKINVISRKDMDNLYVHHILHSLAIAKFIQFKPGSRILDVGTGGGFPGIPLAICFPEVHFTLVDSIGKKIKVVQEVATSCNLTNVRALHERAEKVPGAYDFVVSRAVTELSGFIPWVRKKIAKDNKHAVRNGILYLKGGDISKEIEGINYPLTIKPLKNYFREEFFSTKLLVHVELG